MIKKLTILCLLLGLWSGEYLAQQPSQDQTFVFVSLEELSPQSYALLKTAFNRPNDLVDLKSVCMGAKLLCVQGYGEKADLYQAAEALIEEVLANATVLWEEEMGYAKYIAISKSYRLTPPAE